MNTIAKCLHCNKMFDAFKSLDRKYCSEDCYCASMAGNQNALGWGKKKIKINSVCLGPHCRGHKTFITESKFNRLCKKCAVLNKGYADVGI